MKKIYYNKDGWVCERYPYNIPVDDEDLFVEVEDDEYYKTLSCTTGCAWRFVKNKLVEEIYNEEQHQTTLIETEIQQLKAELQKAKEDVEQVELFGMEREDFETKKQRCAEIVLRLRVLEAQLRGE